MDDKTHTFTAPSIFGLLGGHGLSWGIYGYGAEPLTRSTFTDIAQAPGGHIGLFAGFTAAAAAGTLPAFTFLEPSWGSAGNSQHPNYDVALGEQLIHDVYEAVRGGPGWAQTLLVITYDEHGGCYDHVPPPSGAVPPDTTVGEFGFGFTRFGVRVPTVLVSPLIEAGTVPRVPAGSTPFDHTSILKTVQQRWNLPALTARDAAAPDFGDVLALTTPRTDDVLAGVTVPAPAGPGPAAGHPSHLQEIEAELISRRFPAGVEHPPGAAGAAPARAADYERYIQAHSTVEP
jgi:phospholipase C